MSWPPGSGVSLQYLVLTYGRRTIISSRVAAAGSGNAVCQTPVKAPSAEKAATMPSELMSRCISGIGPQQSM